MPIKQKLNNEQIYNSIRSTLSDSTQDVLPELAAANASDVVKALENYPTARNEFISALTNRVVKTMFFSKLWNNPLKVLKKGMLPFGKTIEQVFVEAGEGINFGSHYDLSNGNDVNDLIGKRVPEVNVDYITENFKKQYKISFSMQQLKGAFLNQTGLNDLMSKSLEAQLTQAELEEYEAIKGLLEDPEMKTIELENAYAKDIAKTIRAYRRKLTFVSDQYNIANVKNHTLPSKFVIFTTPEVEAELDVELYATAFNMSKAELISRVIVIDAFTDPKTQMILADEDYIQVWDTLNEGGEFINPQGLYVNYFLNRWMIVGKCKFANAIAIKKKA